MKINYITPDDYEVAKQNGISESTLYARVYNYFWDIERAITEPVNKPNKYGWKEWKETALSNGVKYDTFKHRVRNGLSQRIAATEPPMSKQDVIERFIEGTRLYNERRRRDEVASR